VSLSLHALPYKVDFPFQGLSLNYEDTLSFQPYNVKLKQLHTDHIIYSGFGIIGWQKEETEEEKSWAVSLCLSLLTHIVWLLCVLPVHW